MYTKEQLLGEMNKIMIKNQSDKNIFTDREDKDILYYERELLSNNVKLPIEIKISELAPELADNTFGTGKFKREEYSLGWKDYQESGFRFVLTNITYSNSKMLLECPKEFKKDCVKLIPKIVELLVNKAKEVLKQ